MKLNFLKQKKRVNFTYWAFTLFERTVWIRDEDLAGLIQNSTVQHKWQIRHILCVSYRWCICRFFGKSNGMFWSTTRTLRRHQRRLCWKVKISPKKNNNIFIVLLNVYIYIYIENKLYKKAHKRKRHVVEGVAISLHEVSNFTNIAVDAIKKNGRKIQSMHYT